MNTRALIVASGWIVLACSPMRNGQNEAASAVMGEWSVWHDAKRDTDRAVAGALNEAGGPDYPRAIAAVRGSDRPASVKDVEVGNLVLSSYANEGRGHRPAETLAKGLALLERGATGSGEGARTAPGFLQLYFARGVRAGARVVLAPDPAIAGCWARVRAGSERAAMCVALRRHGAG